jgi:hypothetical protein
MKWFIDHNLAFSTWRKTVSLDFGPAKYAHEVIMLFRKNWVDNCFLTTYHPYFLVYVEGTVRRCRIRVLQRISP